MKQAHIHIIALLFTFLINTFSFAQDNLITTHFTSLYLGGSSSDFDPSFINLCDKQDFQQKVISWIKEDLITIPQLNFQPVPTQLNQNSDIYLRAILSRADM